MDATLRTSIGVVRKCLMRWTGAFHIRRYAITARRKRDQWLRPSLTRPAMLHRSGNQWLGWVGSTLGLSWAMQTVRCIQAEERSPWLLGQGFVRGRPGKHGETGAHARATGPCDHAGANQPSHACDGCGTRRSVVPSQGGGRRRSQPGWWWRVRARARFARLRPTGPEAANARTRPASKRKGRSPMCPPEPQAASKRIGNARKLDGRRNRR